MTAFNTFPGPSGVTDQTEAGRAFAGTVVKDSAGAPRAGVFMRHTNDLVTARSNMQVDVGAFEAALVRLGRVLFGGNDGTAQVTIPTAPASNQRYDIVWYRQNESASPMSDANDLAALGITSGPTAVSASLSAALALVPAGALVLAAVLMPSGKTATNQSGVTITQLFNYTTMEGGVCPVRSATERDATTWREGQKVWLIDVNLEQIYNSSAWTPGFIAAEAQSSLNSQGAIVGVSSMVSIPSIPVSLGITAQSACRARVTVRFESNVNAAASGYAVGVKQTGASTVTPTTNSTDVFQNVTEGSQGGFRTQEYSFFVDIAAGLTTFEVVAQAVGVGSTRLIRNIMLRVEPVVT